MKIDDRILGQIGIDVVMALALLMILLIVGTPWLAALLLAPVLVVLYRVYRFKRHDERWPLVGSDESEQDRR